MSGAKETHGELVRARDLGVFDRWALPSFDEHPEISEEDAAAQAAPEPEPEPEPVVEEPYIEEVAIEEVVLPTLEEVEAIRQDAYNEGLVAGERDGFHAGQLKAKQEADAALTLKLQGLERIMTHLMQPIAEQDQLLENAMVDLVSHVVREVIQRELRTESAQIVHVLRESLKLLPSGANSVRIYLNPQDFELIKALRERHEETWRILEDESLLPGGCRVESEHSHIDASVETRMELALKQLFEQQRDQSVQPLSADISIELDHPDAP